MSTRLDKSRIIVNRPAQVSAAVANSTNPITNNTAWGIIEGEPDGVFWPVELELTHMHITAWSDGVHSIGDRVLVICLDGVWYIQSQKGTNDKIEQTRDEIVQDFNEKAQDIVDEVEKGLEAARKETGQVRDDFHNFKDTHQLTDDQITHSIEETARELTIAYEGAIEDLDEIYTTKTEFSVGINGVKSTVDEKYQNLHSGLLEQGTLIEQTAEAIRTEARERIESVNGAKSYAETQIEQRANSITASLRTEISDAEKSANKYTDQQLSLTEGSINQHVSETYATKDSLKQYTTTTDVNTVADGLRVSINQAMSRMVYCTCGVAASEQEKKATLSPTSQAFTTTDRDSGCIVIVRFTYSNTHESPTLNVNGLGAAPIRFGSSTNAIPTHWWAAGSAVGFTWNRSNNIWQPVDSSTQNFISTHFDFSNNGLTVYGTASGYKTRVATDAFQILDPNDRVMMNLNAQTKSGGTYAKLTNGSQFGGVILGSLLSSLTIDDNGITMGTGNMAAWDFNKIASVEVIRVAPSSATGDCTVDLSGIGGADLEALDIYYYCSYDASMERRVKRVSMIGSNGNSATAARITLDAIGTNSSGLYLMAQHIVISRSGNKFTFTRDPNIRIWVPVNEADNSSKTDAAVSSIKNSTSGIFSIYWVAGCAGTV